MAYRQGKLFYLTLAFRQQAIFGVLPGIRTPVDGLKTRNPKPLDEQNIVWRNQRDSNPRPLP